jgi:DNA-binding GntR family transcriptional regulator
MARDGIMAARAGSQPSALQMDLARQVVERLRDAGLPPGARVSGPELAAAFGVSRSPVAGALSILTEAGVLARARPRGLAVACELGSLRLERVLPESPHEGLYRRMMRDRALGQLPQEVSEAELLPRYGASRGVIRRILMRFAAEGLAARLPGHGWRFADSLADGDAYRESYEFRLIVECAALAAPGFAVEPERAAAIRRAHDRILEDPRAVQGGHEWFRINADFHEGLASFSRNRFLAEAVRHQTRLRRMQEAAAFSELAVERIIQSSHEHLAILDAAQAGDRGRAEALLKRHIRDAMDYRWPSEDAGRSGPVR